MKLKKLTLLLPAFAIGLITLNSNSGGVGSPDLTNSPQGGNANCTQCHTGTAGSGTVIVMLKDFTTGVPVSQYELGKTYTVDVILSDGTNPPATGFQSTIYTGSSTAHPGTLTANTGSKIIGNFATHTSETSATFTSGTYKWSYNWTAPTTVTATVNIYASCNSADGNNLQTGDKISSGFIQVQQKVNTGVEDKNWLHHALTVAPNPCASDLNVTLNFNLTGSSKYTVLDMFGRTVKQFMSTEINNQFAVQDLASGQYILMLSNGNNRSSVVFNKQ